MNKTNCCKKAGITPRDFFAAAVITGCAGQPSWLGQDEKLANYAYAIASAMLKARAKGEGNPKGS